MSDEREKLIERIDALEAAAAYRDAAIEALSDTIAAQWATIDRLKRQVAELTERFEDAASGPSPVDRPPPHY